MTSDPIIDDLTPDERDALGHHEAAIDHARAGWLPLAAALAAIHAGRLYREDHGSFEAYALARWEYKKRYARYLVAGARTAARLETAGLPVPQAERHARPLNKLAPDDAVAVWRAVLDAAGDPGGVTEPAVRDAVARHREAEADEGRGAGGRPILSDEARVELERVRTQAAAGGKPVPQAPLVAVPPTEHGDGTATGPVLVPGADAVPAGALDATAVAALRDRFATYYAAAGKRGPVLNRTNDHVGWVAWTLNPLTGCTWTCPFCYAREIAALRYAQGFAPTVHPGRLLAPANTAVPEALAGDPAARRVFLMSQADWMDPSFPDGVVQSVLAMCAENPEWEFLTLTKQPDRLAAFEYPDNVWVGVTVTRQGQVAGMESAFAGLDATVRWVSFEPLHGPVALARPDLVDLYVIGAERKTAQRPRVKPTEAAWVDGLRMQARSVGAAVWEKENLDVRLREMPEPRRGSDRHVFRRRAA